jgi:hypothetical protein
MFERQVGHGISGSSVESFVGLREIRKESKSFE